MAHLTGIQQDTLSEIFTMGMGKAGELLNELLDTHITLQAPVIHFYTPEEIDTKLTPQLTEKVGTNASSTVQQNFSGDTQGGVSLIFHPDSALKLVSTLTGEDIASPDLQTLRGGTLMEVGNIVINGILGTLSNQLQCALDFHLPEFRDEHVSKLLQSISPKTQNNMITYVEALFHIKDLQISGVLLIVFNIDNFEYLSTMLEQYYAREIRQNG